MTLDKQLDNDQNSRNAALKDICWFFKKISRSRAETILSKHKKDGMFMVRGSEMCPGDYTISLYARGSFHHYMIKDMGGDRCFKLLQGKIIEGLDTLIDHHKGAEHGLIHRLKHSCPGASLPPPNSVLKGYTNVLHKAVKSRRTETVKLILKHQKCPHLDWKDSDGSTALHIACSDGLLEISRLLIEAGSNVDGIDKEGFTPLHRACQANKKAIVELLLKEGNANPHKAQRPSNHVPLHEAAKGGYEGIVKMLLANGAPAWPRNEVGQCPHDLAVKHGKKACGDAIDEFVPAPSVTKRQHWLHDGLSRDGAVQLLQLFNLKNGYFLVRPSSQGPCLHVISMCYKDKVQHHKITAGANGRAFFLTEGPIFSSLEHLIQHYSKHNDGLDCKLTHSISTEKELWDLNTGEKLCAPNPEGDYGNLAEPREDQLPVPPRTKTSHGDSYQIIPKEELETGMELGQGEYGSVLLGIWKPSGSNKSINVAIKTLNAEHLSNTEVFLQEAKTMVNLKHLYIVELLGVCEGPPIMLVQELLTDGSLQDFLLDFPERITQFDLHRWASQIALGMNYLEESKVVHRDLATRNVLLKNKQQAKVGDFGLSRAVGDNDYYKASKGGRWPVKWYAPECMYYGTFSHASDVWSFGVTLWEMFTFGDQPYGDKTGAEVVQLIEKNYRLPKPDDCPDEIYVKMRNCWEYEAKNRPKFKTLHRFFSQYIGYINVKVN